MGGSCRRLARDVGLVGHPPGVKADEPVEPSGRRRVLPPDEALVPFSQRVRAVAVPLEQRRQECICDDKDGTGREEEYDEEKKR